MIEKMHEKSNGPVFKIIFALVSISFVLGGIGTGLMLHDTSAVKVNGNEISQQQFSNAKSQEHNRRFLQEGQAFSSKLDDPSYVQQLNNDVFNLLINDEVLRQYIQDLNLDITDKQVKSEIVNTPIFHQDGKFDNALYQQTLRNSSITADRYASIVKEGLLRSQVQEGLINTHFSVPAEQELLAKLLMQTRQIRLATYPLAQEAAILEVSDEETQAFYNTHKAEFTTPEQMSVEYVIFSLDDMAKNVTVEDSQIETYYETNKANYATISESQFAHIQVATEEEANSIVQALQNGEDFAKLAKEKSQDKGSAAQGGDLGWAKAGTFPTAFEETAKNLQVGQTSAAIKIDNAFHIIKVLDRKEGNVLPLEQVKTQIRELLQRELTQQAYSSTAREMAKKAYEETKSLDEIAQIGNVAIQRTETFDANHIPEILNNEKITKVLFNGDLRKNGLVSEAIELGNNAHQPQTMFIRVSQYQPESVQSFEEAKDRVIEATKADKAQSTLKTKVEAELAKLQNGENSSAKFSDSIDLVFMTAQLQQPQVAQAVFAMRKPTDKPSYQIAQDRNGDMLIIALDKISDGDLAQMKSVSAQFSEMDKSVLFETIIRDLRDRAKVEINQDFAEQQTNNHH